MTSNQTNRVLEPDGKQIVTIKTEILEDNSISMINSDCKTTTCPRGQNYERIEWPNVDPAKIKHELNNNISLFTIKSEVSVKTELEDIKPYTTKLDPSQNLKKEPNSVKFIFTCCNQQFEDKFEHFQHMKSHTEAEFISAFQCYVCLRVFKSEESMLQHFNACHKYECKYCSQRYKSSYLLKRHINHCYESFIQLQQYQLQQREHRAQYMTWQPQPWSNQNIPYTHTYRSKYNFINRNTGPYSKPKKEQLSKIIKKRKLSNVKVEPTSSNVKTGQPTLSIVKVEPTLSIVKVEPTLSIVKVEPTLSMVKVEPTSSIDNVVQDYNLNVKIEPTLT